MLVRIANSEDPEQSASSSEAVMLFVYFFLADGY